MLARAAREAAEFLQGQVTNDVEALAPGEGCYAALLDHKGKLRADMRVLRLGDDGCWSTPRRSARAVLQRTTSRPTASAATSRART